MFTINGADFAKGIVMAVITAVLTWLLQMLDVPGFSVSTIDWGMIGRIAMTAGLGYIVKNYLSNEKGQVVTPLGNIG